MESNSIRRLAAAGSVMLATLALSCEEPAPEPTTSTETEEEFGLGLSALHPGDPIPGRYLVRLRADALPAGAARNPEAIEQLATELQIRVGPFDREHVYAHSVRGFSMVAAAHVAERLSRDPLVLSVEPDRVVRALGGPVRADAKGGTPLRQVLPWGIDRVDADLSATAKIDSADTRVDVDVAVLDTGIDLSHKDLNVVGGKNCISWGKNTYQDGNGHGTHVSGTIAAIDNAQDVVGVAPGARLWAVRVLDNSGNGSWATVACGVEFVTANAGTIDVANLSLGGLGHSELLHAAMQTSIAGGVTYVIAAGNDGADASDYEPAHVVEAITVSATNEANGWPSWSNYGSIVDLAAPGFAILSTKKGGGVTTMSGTSMAAPHVTGGAALYKASHPVSTPAEVEAALVSGAVDVGVDGPHGEDLLNVQSF